MAELFEQLGIDWRLLLSQAANFLLLLIVLRIFAYKPLMQLLKERRARIEEGLLKAKEADTRLKEIDVVAMKKRKETEQEAIALMRETELKAKEVENKLLEAAREKETTIIKNADLIIQAKAAETKRRIQEEATAMVKAAIAKTVELDPKTIDEILIKKAVAQATKNT